MWKRSIVAAALLLAVLGLWSVVRTRIPSYIDYQGQKIRLTKYYLDYDDYKDDPNNIAPSETARVQRLVMSAHIDPKFPDRKAAVNAVFEVKVPGYGAGSMLLYNLPDGDVLTGFSVEIPRLDKDRYFIFRSHNGKYTLIDDFVADEVPLLAEVRAEGDEIVLFSMDHKPVLRRKLDALSAPAKTWEE